MLLISRIRHEDTVAEKQTSDSKKLDLKVGHLQVWICILFWLFLQVLRPPQLQSQVEFLREQAKTTTHHRARACQRTYKNTWKYAAATTSGVFFWTSSVTARARKNEVRPPRRVLHCVRVRAFVASDTEIFFLAFCPRIRHSQSQTQIPHRATIIEKPLKWIRLFQIK